MNKKIKIGVIGTGKIGRLHLDSVINYIPEAEVVQVADPFISEETITWLKDHGVVNITKNSEEVI